MQAKCTVTYTFCRGYLDLTAYTLSLSNYSEYQRYCRFYDCTQQFFVGEFLLSAGEQEKSNCTQYSGVNSRPI